MSKENTKASILLVEDEENLHDALKLNLELEGYEVSSAYDGSSAVKAVQAEYFDLIILDVMLPEMDGINVTETIRLANNEVPILILSAKNSSADKVLGLKKGADDYMTKPFHGEELAARLRSLVRRSNGYCDARICFGPMTLDLAAKTLEAHGRRIGLSAKEYQILELLSLRRGVTVSKETLISHIYGDGEGPDSRTMEVFVHRLRRKLATACEGGGFIETVRDHGYLMRRAA